MARKGSAQRRGAVVQAGIDDMPRVMPAEPRPGIALEIDLGTIAEAETVALLGQPDGVGSQVLDEVRVVIAAGLGPDAEAVEDELGLVMALLAAQRQGKAVKHEQKEK